MFNNKGESKMNEQKNVWLVIEKNIYGDNQVFTVAKKAYSLQDAVAFKFALDKLNDRNNQSYFVATEIESGFNEVVKLHNKSVEDGSYYERHPEVKRPDKQPELPFK
jgi:hypothetical protein